MQKEYPADLRQLGALAADIDAFCAANNAQTAAFALNLSADELFTNAVSYGYRGDASGKISVSMRMLRGGVEMVIEDSAPQFDPFSAEEPELSGDVSERKIGGLGVFFVKKNMDEYSYARRGGKNIITLFKKI